MRRWLCRWPRLPLTFLATVAAFPKGFLDEAMALQVAETALEQRKWSILEKCKCVDLVF